MGARVGSRTVRASRAAAGVLVAIFTAVAPVALLGAPAASAQGASCADSWTNPAGGQWNPATSNFDSDWSTGAPPSAGESACITIPLSGPVVLGNPTSTSGFAGSLTLGGTSGTDELVLDNATLSLGSSSAVERTGEITTLGAGYLDMQGSAVLTNDGDIQVGGSGNGLELYGNITNAPDGWVSVSNPSDLTLATGTFTNNGELTVGAGAQMDVPYEDSTGAVLYNANGQIQNQGFINVNGGGTFEEGSGTVVGIPAQYDSGIQITNGTLDLVGKGASSFELAGGTLAGTVAAGQTVVLDSGEVLTAGSVTNDGTILVDRPGGAAQLTLPAGRTLTNNGSIVVPANTGLELEGNVANKAKGTIAVSGSSAGGSSLTLEGAVTMTNDGTVSVGAVSSSLSAGNSGTIDNAAGTIANAGTVTVPVGATFTEGSGATTGNPVQVSGRLDLTGSGASTFQLGGTMSGNVAAGQTVELGYGLGSAAATGSFTNDGTLVGNGSLSLPYGDTLTNDGTIEIGHSYGGQELTLSGNLTNAAGGVIGEDGGTLQMAGTGTTFDNAGTLELLYQNNLLLDGCSPGPCENTFDNTGTIDLGTDSAGAQWGSGAYDSYFQPEAGDTVELGGTITPVPNGEPSGGTGNQITYNIGGGSSPGTPPTWSLSCSASVTGGWSLDCSNGTGAELVEPTTTLEPTTITVTGSGTSYSAGWKSTYGEPVALTATVSAQDGATPTGTVAFYAAQQDTSPVYTPAAIGPDLLGTATLSTSAGVTSATLVTSSLPPGQYELLALYGGDAADLAASTTYSSSAGNEEVSAESTTVSVASSPASSAFGSPVTFTATVTPAGYGPADPTGTVTFSYGGTVIGAAPVVTKSGVTTATLTTTALPTGTDSITASYGGDYDYAGSTTSTADSQSVASETAPTEVTVDGPSTAGSGTTYKATATTNGTGATFYALASTPAPPAGMTIGATTGAVSFKVPASGTSSFSYAVVATDAAGEAESSVVSVTVSVADLSVWSRDSGLSRAASTGVSPRAGTAGSRDRSRAPGTPARPVKTVSAQLLAFSRVVSGSLTGLDDGGPCADSWTNSAGGAWATGSNWSNGAPPNSGESACITIPLSAPVLLSGAGSAASLTIGDSSGTGTSDVLALDGGTLVVDSASNVAETGELTDEGGGGTLATTGAGAFTNDGIIDSVGSGIRLSGDVTNEADGLVLVASQLAVDTGTFTNLGELSVQPGATVEAPHGGGSGATIDNAAGTTQNQGAIDIVTGGTFEEGSGSLIGTAPLISGGTLDIAGKGASRFELTGDSTVSGPVATGQTLLLDGAVSTSGAETNDGSITLLESSTLTLPGTDKLTNSGSIVVVAGDNLELAGNLENTEKGSITVADGTLTLETPLTLTNDGTLSVGPSGSLVGSSAATVDNAAGTLANGGTVEMPAGSGFVEGSGATTGDPVQVNGTLDIAGTGASSFKLAGLPGGAGGYLSGNVAAGQTLWAAGVINAAASFTNNGTMVFSGGGAGPLNLPDNSTLTNQGTIEFSHGSGMTVDGNVLNAPTGVMGEGGAAIDMDGLGNTFENAGVLEYLFSTAGILDGCDCTSNNTFANTGTVYWGVASGGAEWGGFGLASDIGSGIVELGGTIVPVPYGTPSGGSGDQISYGIATDASCSAAVTSGWSLSCVNGNAMLIEPSTTLEPTEVTLTSTGTTFAYGWESTYGQPVTLTATVSAGGGNTPTGTVAFYATQVRGSNPEGIAPDLLGTGDLSTSGGVTTASLTTSLPPGQYELLAFYSGDSSDLAAATENSATSDNQAVSAQSTALGLASSPASSAFGSPVTFTATVTPGGYGPDSPGGVVTFVDGSTVIGSAPVVTAGGTTTATLTTSNLPVGSDSITASYSGDYNYTGSSTSSPTTYVVSAPTAPTTVEVIGPATVKPGTTYKATVTTDGTGAVLYLLASTPSSPAGMTIGAAGAVSFKVPATGTSSFSYAVIAINALGEAESSVVEVTVS